MGLSIKSRLHSIPHLKNKIIGFTIILVLMSTLAAGLFVTDILSEIENRTWDWRIKATVDPKTADPLIKIIMIDQNSLEFFAQEDSTFWPWPRGIYEAVLEFLRKGRARAAAFDILFTEQSQYGVKDDESFANAMKGSMPIVAAGALRKSKTALVETFPLFREKQLSQNRTEYFAERYLTTTHPRSYNAITLPIIEILQSGASIGSATAEPDSDGIYRHTIPGGYVENVPILALPFALYESGRGKDSQPVINSYDRSGRLAVRFHGPARSYETFPINAIIQSFRRIDAGLEPSVKPEVFKDAWVFIGMDAPGLLDLRPTPLSETFPGVEYNATVLDNIIHNDFITKTTLSTNLVVTFTLLALLSAAIIFLNSVPSQILLCMLTLSIFILGCFVAASNGIWVAMTVPIFTSVTALLSSLGFQYKLEGQQHRFIKGAFKNYVSPELIDEMIRNPASLSLGGAKREVTVFFSDLEGFTTISESLEAERLALLLNEYLSAMTDIILASGGTLDKYEGDAIIAFWNAPLEVPNHALRGVQAAIDCQRALSRLREQFRSKYGVTLKMRIGIHTGIANVGNFGSKERFNYTIIGDAPNLSSRLEGTNKVFGTQILFSEGTRAHFGDSIPARKIGSIQVVGKTIAVPVYEPVDNLEAHKIFEEGRTLFEAGDVGGAEKIFETISNDIVAQKYLKRISELEKSKPFNPVWILSSK